MLSFVKTVSYVAFVNDFDTNERAWNPELWAKETLVQLYEELVAYNLVHTDFSNEISNFGDTVNTRLPGTFSAKRKGTNDDVTVQAATADKVAIVLNQHVHTSIVIKDGEESRSMVDLINEYMKPIAHSLAKHMDQVILAQAYQFLDNQVEIDPDDATSTIKNAILRTRKELNDNLVPDENRNLILTSESETEALELDLFISADKIGDDGTAMRKASLGEKFGLQTFRSPNASSIASGTSTIALTNAGGSTDGAITVNPAGATTLVMTTGTAVLIDAGMYVTFSTCGGVYRVVSSTDTELVLDRGLMSGLPDDSLATFYTVGAVDLTGDAAATTYPIGYAKDINIAAAGVIPQVGQLVGFGDSDHDPVRVGEYGIVAVNTGSGAGDYYITLDRPLEAALEDSDVVDYGPAGEYNFAFDRDAIAVVARPLAMPRTGAGAIAGIAQFGDLALRIVITYEGRGQGHLCTADLLMGVKVLDERRGAVMIR